MIILIYHGAPVVSSVYHTAGVILSAGYGGQGRCRSITVIVIKFSIYRLSIIIVLLE